MSNFSFFMFLAHPSQRHISKLIVYPYRTIGPTLVSFWFREHDLVLIVPDPGQRFLAHLSRRLIGELIVYEGIRRPSVRRPSVVRLSTFSNDISSEAVRPILLMGHI